MDKSHRPRPSVFHPVDRSRVVGGCLVVGAQGGQKGRPIWPLLVVGEADKDASGGV